LSKKTRNKFRDMVGDYYITNREVDKENRRRREEAKKTGEEKKSWSPTEKVLLVIIVIGAIGIVIKYLVF